MPGGDGRAAGRSGQVAARARRVDDGSGGGADDIGRLDIAVDEAEVVKLLERHAQVQPHLPHRQPDQEEAVSEASVRLLGSDTLSRTGAGDGF